MLDVSEHIDALGREGALFASAASQAGFATAVPSCPDWVVRDLIWHLGGVHRWATEIVSRPRTEFWDVDLDEDVGSIPNDSELIDWYVECHSAMVDALAIADPNLVCWTFLFAPSPLSMWARRQAHETAIHRVDAELASGRTLTAFPQEFAADGIDELLACFITRPAWRLRVDQPRSLHFSCTDSPSQWLVRMTLDGVRTSCGASDADCHVSGRAGDLYLALWSRKPADDLLIEGDGRVLESFLDRVHIRWDR